MAARFCVFLSALLFSLKIAPEFFPRLIVWNVGQGLWLTLSDSSGCWHFDMGGEKAPIDAVARLCRTRPNFVTLSHWDSDHISMISSARQALPRLCRMNTPLGRPSPPKQAMVERVPLCPKAPPYPFWEEVRASSNGMSRVVSWRGILMPGDSSSAEEKIWIENLRGVESARVLILGHHGSQSSTSKELLNRAGNLKLAIASARKRRFGHPHRRVKESLMDFRVPLLTTEEWGHIVIEL